MTPLNDKINNSVFHLNNQARPLHFHVFIIPTPVCTILAQLNIMILAQSKGCKKLTSRTPLYHLKICLISSLFYAKCIRDMTLPFTDASRSWDFLSGLGAVCRSNCQQVQICLLQFKIVDSLYLPVFQYIAAVDFVQQFVHSSSAKHVMLNSF